MFGYIDNQLSKAFGAFGTLAFPRFPFAAALVFFLAITHLDAKQVIVDDTEIDKITYFSDGWKVGPNCSSSCSYVNTWHEGSTLGTSDPVSFVFKFTGTSVEVIYLPHVRVDVHYLVDNTPGSAVAPVADSYNKTLFKKEGLENIQHTLWVEIFTPNATLFFDSIIYDDGIVVASPGMTSLANSTVYVPPTSNSTSPTGSSPNIGAIVGGVVAGIVVVVVVVVFALIWYLRRRIQRLRSDANANAPPLGVQTQELPGSHHYASPGIASSSLPTRWAFAPQPSLSSQTGTHTPTMEPNPTRALHRGTNSNHYSFRPVHDHQTR